MRHEERLLRAMGTLEEDYLMEAWNYKGGSRRRMRRGLILAAVVAVLAMGITAVATNQSWQEIVRGWFGVGAEGAGGYAEYGDQSVAFDGLNIRLLSELCSGDELVAFFEVTPVETETFEPGKGLEVGIADQEELVGEVLEEYKLETVSASEDGRLLKLTVSFIDMSVLEQIDIQFFFRERQLFSEIMTLEVLDTPVLAAELNMPVRNEAANADGYIQSIRICSGSLEVLVDYEMTEHWCDRECVPDGGERFCKAYYGEDWESQGVREEPALFSREDERAIFQGYDDSWRDTVRAKLESMKVIRKDGTKLQIEGEPFRRGRSVMERVMEGYDTEVYRYTLLPLVDLEEIASVELMGEQIDMEWKDSAR